MASLDSALREYMSTHTQDAGPIHFGVDMSCLYHLAVHHCSPALHKVVTTWLSAGQPLARRAALTKVYEFLYFDAKEGIIPQFFKAVGASARRFFTFTFFFESSSGVYALHCVCFCLGTC
jgi:hypothetical protein